jgi:hypothetical protein
VNEFDSTSLNKAYLSALQIQKQSVDSTERINYQLLIELIRKFVRMVPTDTLMTNSVNTLKLKYQNLFDNLKQRVNIIDKSIPFYNADVCEEDNSYFYQPNSNEYLGSPNIFVKSIGSKPYQKNKIIFYSNLLLMVDTENSVQDQHGIVETITNCIMKLRPSTDTPGGEIDSTHPAQSAYSSLYKADSTSVGKIESMHICQKNGIPYVFVIQHIRGNTFRSVAKYIQDLHDNPNAEDHKDSLQTINKMLPDFIKKNCVENRILIQNPQPEDFYVCINSDHEIEHITFVNPYKVHLTEHRPSPTDDMLQSIASMMKKANVSILRYQLCAVAYQLSKNEFLEKLFPSGTQYNETDPLTNNTNTEEPLDTGMVPDVVKSNDEITQNPKNAVQNDAVQNNDVQNDAVQNDAVQNNDVQNDAVQNDAVQNDDVQNNDVQNDAVQNNDVAVVAAEITQNPKNAVQNDAVQNDDVHNDDVQNDDVQNDAVQNNDVAVVAAEITQNPKNAVQNDAVQNDAGVMNNLYENVTQRTEDQTLFANNTPADDEPVEDEPVEDEPVEEDVEDEPVEEDVEDDDMNANGEVPPVEATNKVDKQYGGRHTQKHLPSTSHQTMKQLKPSQVITHSIKASGGNISTARTHRNQQSKLDRAIHMLRRQLLKRLKQKKTLAKDQ